jgi:hypothetical protein
MWGIYIHVALLYDYDKLATVGLGTKEVASGHGNYSDLSFFRRVKLTPLSSLYVRKLVN